MAVKQLCIGAVLVATTALVTTQVVSQDKEKKSSETVKSEQQVMMEKWLELAAPGEHHKKLDVLVGEWITTWKHWQSPDEEPEETSGAASFKWILDGRFVKGQFTGDMMGMPFEGIFFMGYNNFRERYEATWLSNVETSMTSFIATLDPAGKVFTFTGTMDDVMTGQKDKPFKSVFRIVSDDKMVETMYSPDARGKEVKQVEVTYERVK